ncbi:PAS domain S-box protein [Maridesulfovibrio ferrireducens]|uniref:PAS domain S-box protein n=1 Tax=Maridesulfovibrio ferrireducens TaxID=246191 RepID=UPI001A255F48|nr:PAS domain S-box protein [Maridesulfovibrio ferrireducens]MBI9111949.1 PAS domain S-box protein [Maridesulfovibrio ferrireducens]
MIKFIRRILSFRITLSMCISLAVLLFARSVLASHAEEPVFLFFSNATEVVLVSIVLLVVFLALRAFLWTTGLRTKLISSFLFISLVPICILSILDQKVTSEALSENSRQAMLAAASHTAESIDSFILANLSTVRTESTISQFAQYLSLPPDKRAGSPEELAAMGILTSLKRRDQTNITSLALLDLSGRAVADTFGYDIGLDKSNRDYFLIPIETGLPYVAAVGLSESAQQPSLYFSSPVRDTSGRILGVLRSRYNAAVLQQMILPRMDIEDHAFSAALFGDEGLRLADSHRPDLVLTPTFTLYQNVKTQIASERRITVESDQGLVIGMSRKELSDPGVTFFHTSLYGPDSEPTLNVKVRLRYMPWTIVLGYSEAANLAKIATQSHYALVVVLCIVLAVLLVAVGVTRGITHPVLALTGAARALSGGEDKVFIPIESDDEIGELAVTFNQMSKALFQSRQRLLASTERLQSLLDTLPDTVILHDAEGSILDANQSFENTFGHSLNEAHNLSIEDISGGGLTEKDALHLIDSCIEHGLQAFDWVARRKDGSEFPTYVRLRRLDLPEGLRIMAVITDIAERKQGELDLLNARNYIANIIDSMPSVLVSVDAEGDITQWNIQAEKATGLKKQAVTGHPLGEILPYLSDEMERVHEAMRCRSPLEDSKRVHMIDGVIRYENITIFPLIANGIDGAVIRIDDVTERVRLEQILVQSEKMLSVGGLAAGMAHEINNPLAAILGYTQNIRNRLFGEKKSNIDAANECDVALDKLRAYLELREIPKMLDGIYESGNRAAKIVSNMLNFSRKSGDNFTKHDIAVLLDQSIELIMSDYDLKKSYDFKQISVYREYDPSLPPVYCEGNQIQQVFLNLFKNAGEAMTEKDYKDGSPFFVLRTSEKDGMAVIQIEDNGPGMNPDICNRAFEPFFSTKATGKGTGLGLSVSYFIITDQHGGSMEVFSEPGQWTRFVIKLPLLRESDINNIEKKLT